MCFLKKHKSCMMFLFTLWKKKWIVSIILLLKHTNLKWLVMFWACLPQLDMLIIHEEVNLCWRCCAPLSTRLARRSKSPTNSRDNYQTCSRRTRYTMAHWLPHCWSPLWSATARPSLHASHPRHRSPGTGGKDILFHNKTRCWLLSAPANWT